MKIRLLLLVSYIIVILSGCNISYSFTGASYSPEVKTVSIKDFPNRAPTNNPTLSNYFSEELRSKFMNQTPLELIDGSGDLQFEGAITGYTITSEAMQANSVAALSRLTIQIQVKFVNVKEPDRDFDKSFTDFATFESASGLSEYEDQLVVEIIDKLIDKIFNDSVANW